MKLHGTSRNLLLLFIVYACGFTLLLLFHFVFTGIMDNLDHKVANEQSRYRIGEYIVKKINGIESNFYQMAVAMSEKSAKIISADIFKDVEAIRAAIKVLEKGGAIEETITLNLANKEQVTHRTPYTPTNEEAFILESIELEPKLEDILVRTDVMENKIISIEGLMDTKDSAQIIEGYESIQLFLKISKPLFVRMKENASRMLFESKNRVLSIEEEISDQKSRYVLLEIGVILLILAATAGFGGVISLGISRTNKNLKEAITEANELAKRAETAKLEAQRAEAAKGMFLANMSHEIRTPLNGIIGFSELLKKENLHPKHKEHIGIINNSAKSLLAIINDILDLSKINSGNFSIEKSSFNPIETFEQTAELFAAKASEKDHDFIFKLDKNIPPCLIGDKTRIQQVLVNLLGNAVKFTDVGGKVTFAISVSAIDEAECKLLFRVNDSGIGISKENLEKIFEPFMQAEGGASRKYGGTGLGLNISKNVIEQMGSRIFVESSEGKGSSFFFELTLEICNQEANSRSDKSEIMIGLCRAKEDNWEQVRITAEYLENLTRVNYVDEIQSPPDILVVHSGGSLDEDIKRCRETFSSTPVILITKAHELPIDENTKKEFADILHQPIHPSKLLDSIMGVVAEKNFDTRFGDVSESSEGTVYKGRVLVAEDNAVNMKLITILLNQAGIEPQCVSDGALALERYQKEGADLIFMDINMPNLNGDEATKKIREYEANAGIGHVKIVALTANAIKGDKERFLACGMDDYLTKPIHVDALKEVLKKYLIEAQDAQATQKSSPSKKSEEGYGAAILAAKLQLPQEVCAMLLKNFLSTIDKDMQILEELINEEKTDEIIKKCHYIRSACLNLRMEGISDILQRIEEAVKNKEGQSVRDCFCMLKNEIEVVKASLKTEEH